MTALAVPEAPAFIEVEMIPLDQIDPATDNPRRDVGDVTELAASIAAQGLHQPLLVTPRDDRYLLVCGARRHAACAAAGVFAVACVIREFTETERQEAMLTENLQRVDLTPLEEAESYKRLTGLGHTQRQIAQRIGRSQAHISKRVALLDLPEKVREQVDSGGITLEDAQQLTRLLVAPKRLAALAKRYADRPIPSWVIEEELRDVERDAKTDRKIAALKKQGQTVIRMRDYFRAPDGAEVVDLGGWNGVDMDPAKHAKEPCHAIGVRPGGDTVELCTDPSRHPKAKATAAPGLTREQKAAQKLLEQLEADVPRRREFVGELVRGKVTKDDALACALDGILGYPEYDAEEIAARALQLEPPGDAEPDAENPYEGEYLAPALRERAARGEAERLRVVLACAIGVIEEQITHAYGRWTDTNAAVYFAFLASKGYEISKAEQAKLDEVAKAEAEAEAAQQ